MLFDDDCLGRLPNSHNHESMPGAACRRVFVQLRAELEPQRERCSLERGRARDRLCARALARRRAILRAGSRLHVLAQRDQR